MTDLRTAAQQALEALEWYAECSMVVEPAAAAMNALRAALAEPVQEPKPVAWMHVPYPGNGMSPLVSRSEQREPSMYAASVPLYLKEQL